jgi:hypothetical protein
MKGLLAMPTEVLQQIASFFSLRDKHNFLATTKQAPNAFYNNAIEQHAVWDKIFKDTAWLKHMLSQRVTPTLIGYDLKYMQEGDKFKSDRLVIALTLARPRRNCYKADKREVLASLRSDCFCEVSNEVYFSGFVLHIGCLFNNTSLFHDWECLLEEKSDFTLVLYYEQNKTQTFPLDITIIPTQSFYIDIKDCQRVTSRKSKQDTNGKRRSSERNKQTPEEVVCGRTGRTGTSSTTFDQK